MVSHGLEYLKTDKFLGVVVDTDDPSRSGRCRVKVFHLMNEMANDDIPWACPMSSTSFGSNGSGSISVPTVNTIVGVQFNCGDPYSPEYYGIPNAAIGASEIVSETYENGEVITSDDDKGSEISITTENGMKLGLGDSLFQFDSDGKMHLNVFGGTSGIGMDNNLMTLHTDDKIGIGGETNKQVDVKSNDIKIQAENIVQLSGSEDHEYAVNAKALVGLLKQLATMIDAKAPQATGAAVSLVDSKASSLINSKVTYCRK